MLIRFTIEAEKVLEALGRNYDLPAEIDWPALEGAVKAVYFVDKSGDFLDMDISIEVEVK